MSDPEISRRCTACGATIRQRALFCPQCGQAISGASENTPMPEKTVAQKEAESAQTIALDKVELNRPVVPAPTQPVDHSRSTMRPSDDRQGTEENIRGRVQKLRKASHIVLDQAAYDPSLRFLLVAAGLIIVVLVLMFLSKMLS